MAAQSAGRGAGLTALPDGVPERMKALVKEKEGPSYDYKDVPVPVPREGELLVRVEKVALCGSDIALHQWNNGK